MRNIITIVLLAVCFIIPLHFFVLGHDVGYGIQGAYYQLKVTGYGTNFFTATSDLMYAIKGTYTGRTLVSDILWLTGSVLLTIGTISWLLDNPSTPRFIPYSGILIIMSAVLYLISAMLQYGLFFYGPAGISIPYGIPLIIFIGYLILKFKSHSFDEHKVL
jgi:hypothetical protein